MSSRLGSIVDRVAMRVNPIDGNVEDDQNENLMETEVEPQKTDDSLTAKQGKLIKIIKKCV